MPRGGKRTGAGRPKGTVGVKHAATISKEQAREALRAIVLRDMDALVSAQLAHAKGLRYLVVRQKGSGKFVRVTEAMARAKEGSDEEIIEVWEKDPSVQAFTDLLNRALDKPKEQEQELRITGELELVAPKLVEARKRLALKA